MTSLPHKIVVGLIFLFVVFIAWFFSDVVAYVLISMVFWFILTPVVNFLDYTAIKGRSLPRWLASILSIVIFGLLVAALGSFIVPKAVDQAVLMADLDVNGILKNFEPELKTIEDKLAKYNISDNPKEDIYAYFQSRFSIIFGQLGDLASVLLGMTGSFIMGIFAVFFITFFFLKDESLVKRIIVTITPDKYMDNVGRVMTNAKKLLSRYFIGLSIQVLLICLLISIGLTIIGIENAWLIGVFAGFINVIPYIGPLIGAAFGLFVALSTQLHLGIDASIGSTLLQVSLVFLTVQMLDNFLFQPIIFANSVHAHPLEIFLIIFIAAKLGGIVGMICAIPAYTLFRIFGKEFFTQFKLIKNLTKNI